MTGHAEPEEQPAASGGGEDTRLDIAEVQAMLAWANALHAHCADGTYRRVAALASEVLALRAENAELRESLRWALRCIVGYEPELDDWPEFVVARKLLEEKP